MSRKNFVAKEFQCFLLLSQTESKSCKEAVILFTIREMLPADLQQPVTALRLGNWPRMWHICSSSSSLGMLICNGGFPDCNWRIKYAVRRHLTNDVQVQLQQGWLAVESKPHAILMHSARIPGLSPRSCCFLIAAQMMSGLAWHNSNANLIHFESLLPIIAAYLKQMPRGLQCARTDTQTGLVQPIGSSKRYISMNWNG